MSRMIVITGAGAGIGRALTINLAKEDISVFGIGRHLETLLSTQQQFPSKIRIMAADLTNSQDRSRVIEEILKLKQPISLVNNAGTAEPLSLLKDIQLDDWQNSLRINVEAPLFLAQGLLTPLQGGRILQISSGLAHYPRSGMGAYCVSKAALYMLSQCLAAELQPYDIYVGSVMPGVVDTAMQELICATPQENFPGVRDFTKIRDNSQYVSAEVVADFLAWLLLKTSNAEFSSKEWDISDQSHHSLWLKDDKVNLLWKFD